MLNCDALDLFSATRKIIGRNGSIRTIVSSLPLRNFTPEFRSALTLQIAKTLHPEGHFIQYTYAVHRSQNFEGLKLLRSERIWRNLPPARIGVYQLNVPELSRRGHAETKHRSE